MVPHFTQQGLIGFKSGSVREPPYEPLQRELVDTDVVCSLCCVTDQLERSLTLWLIVVVEVFHVQRLEAGWKRPQARTRYASGHL